MITDNSVQSSISLYPYLITYLHIMLQLGQLRTVCQTANYGIIPRQQINQRLSMKY